MLPLAAPLACLLVVFVFQMAYGFFIEARGKRQISELFANYVPPELVQIMAQDPQAFTMAPVERELTVLFADVRDFTSISEHLSPEALSELINAYLTAMSEVIRDGHQGTLDKYIGDAVMAFWGAPVPNANHAQDAVRAAVVMQGAAQRLNQEFLRKGWPQLSIGIGLNTGPMRVGDMGSKFRRAYTVMGDAVHLGARHQGLGAVLGQRALPFCRALVSCFSFLLACFVARSLNTTTWQLVVAKPRAKSERDESVLGWLKDSGKFFCAYLPNSLKVWEAQKG
jgi:adenylate cyclase